MTQELREELNEKSEEDLLKLAEANGLQVEEGCTKDQLVELLILQAEGDLPPEAEQGAP